MRKSLSKTVPWTQLAGHCWPSGKDFKFIESKNIVKISTCPAFHKLSVLAKCIIAIITIVFRRQEEEREALEEERQRREEEESLRMAAEAREMEEERLQKAIEAEDKRKAEEAERVEQDRIAVCTLY